MGKRLTALAIGVLCLSVLLISVFSIFLLQVNVVHSDALDTSQPPVGYWKFDEGQGSIAHDSSGNGNDGTIHTATWTTGKIGNAFHFNGIDSWVEIPSSSTLTGLSQITLEAWIEQDSLTTELKGIISKCDGWSPPANAEYFLGSARAKRQWNCSL